MKNKPFVFAVIPARGGSKGLPGKNIRPLAGKPLIAWTIAAARKSRRLSRTIVSTDDKKIATAARACGGEAPFLRPAALATDHAGMAGVVQHAARWLEASEGVRPDVIVLLQPTSPLRTAKDIDDAVDLLLKTGADSVQTVAVDAGHPWHRFLLGKGGRITPLHDVAKKYPRRQDAPPLYRPTGAVDALRYDVVMKDGAFQGRDHRGLVRDWKNSIDVDGLWDLRTAEMILHYEKNI